MVSIIIPIYNVEKYLRTCLDSVLAQTYTDYEVIMVDDGSTDKSDDIAKEYQNKDTRFHLIRQENKGLASARNTGIRVAKGEYIYFIDSDDCINPSLLKIVVEIAQQKNANIVQINLQAVPEGDTNFDRPVHIENIPVQEYSTIQALRNLDEDNQNYARDIRLTTTVVWTKLYRREAFKNFLFPEGMRMHEDQMVAHRRIAEAGGMMFLDCPLYYYRQNNTSLIRVGWTPKRLSIIDCYEDRLRCVIELAKKERTAEADKLKDYIYWRYLVCLFRNYDMICINMSGDEQKEKKKMVLQKVKQLLKEQPGRLSSARKIFFLGFCIAPNMFQKLFRIRNKLKK